MCFVYPGGVQIKEQRLLQSHMIVHQLASQKMWLFQIKPIHLALEFDCLNVWNFMTQFPCRFFRRAIKWSRSQGNHEVLAETSMIRLIVVHIKHIIHISTNIDNGGKSIVCILCKLHCFLTCLSSSLQPGQLITSSHHWLCLYNNKNAINIYGNAAWKQEATPSLMPAVCTRLRASVCVCVRACVPAVCTQILCSEGIARFDVLQCRQLLIPLLACTELMQATLVLLPQKLVHFNAKWSKIEISYIQVQPEDISTKRQNHTLYLGR